MPQVAVWYAKDIGQAKYRQLYEPLTRREIVEFFTWHIMVELSDGMSRSITDGERFDPDKFLPKGARIYCRAGLDSQGVSTTGRSEPYEWQGKVCRCGEKRQWSISKAGMDRLVEFGRLAALGEAELSEVEKV